MQRHLRRVLALLAAGGLLGGVVISAPTALAGDASTYVVLYRSVAVPADVAQTVSRAGGTLVASYGQIGVAIARSSSATFKSALAADSRIAAVAATDRTAIRLRDLNQDGAAAGAEANTPVSDTDPLSSYQWDMVQIHTPEAHAITGGSASVVVGDIDTGLDYTHPDLAANVSDADSANCLSGAPVQGKVAAADDNGHGTHTAGTIAAGANGIGIVGVAPNVKIAGIKAGNSDGFFFPEAVICAFMWAGTRHVDVTNNSYFADPWLFNCKNDPDQRAIFSAEQRAIKFAESSGTVVVAAAGNQSDDLAHPTQDSTSPDDTTPVVRDVTNACAVIPVEVPGVVGVSGDGVLKLKSFFSSYGSGAVQVVAPSGDSILQPVNDTGHGRVLSTYPSYRPCTRKIVDQGATYCWLQGTSMASPHVAGVAALIRSVFPGLSPGAVTARLTSTADPMACPSDMSIYAPFPAVENNAPQVCTGGKGYNSFYGHGLVNAESAIK